MIISLLDEAWRNALIAGGLTAIAAGIMGVYIVIRRMVSISGSVAHASLSGVGLGLLAGINPVLGALLLTPPAALGMGMVVKKTKLPEDTAIGMLWATGMALGVILAALAHNTANLSIYLFGDIFSVADIDLILMGILDGVIILVIFRFYHEFLSFSFDEEFSRIVGVPTNLLYFLFLVLVAFTVVTMVRVVGIILMIALLTIPAALSRRLTARMPQMILLSCVFSLAFIFAGLFVSLQLSLPSGAVIAILCGVVFLLFLVFSSQRFKSENTGEWLKR
jgi:zinc transport system permease protein